jgi:hypothetical protein
MCGCVARKKMTRGKDDVVPVYLIVVLRMLSRDGRAMKDDVRRRPVYLIVVLRKDDDVRC